MRAAHQALPALAQVQCQDGSRHWPSHYTHLFCCKIIQCSAASCFSSWNTGRQAEAAGSTQLLSIASFAAGLSSSGGAPRFGSGALAGTSGASAALRSEDLLARMRSRQQVLTTAAQDDATAAASADPPSVAGPSSSYTIAETISRQLVDHLQQHSGAASSSQIITSFPNIDQQHAVLFKQTLRQVAVLQRGAAGGKQWHLKPEFDKS